MYSSISTSEWKLKRKKLNILKYYLLDWYDGGKCCADPPVMSQREMTKGPLVFSIIICVGSIIWLTFVSYHKFADVQTSDHG